MDTLVDTTFQKIVQSVSNKRTSGDEGVVKRADIRSMMTDSPNITYPDAQQSYHISLGYAERLFRKLSDYFPSALINHIDIAEYREACGSFAGVLTWLGRDENGEELQYSVEFEWEGSGKVETSWDNFPVWQVNSYANNG